MPTEHAEFPLLEHALSHARECLEGLTDPEEDILPVLLSMGPYGLGVMPLLGMSNDEAKDSLAQMMITTLACSRADQAVMITTSWMVKAKLDENGKPSSDLLKVMPRDDPDRIEAVTAMYVGPGGDSMSSATLTRYPDKPPTMSEWETSATDATLGGRFGNAVHMGIELAAAMNPELIEILDDGWRQGEQDDLMKRFHKVFTGMTAAPTWTFVAAEGDQ